jgi:hypothetical protein
MLPEKISEKPFSFSAWAAVADSVAGNPNRSRFKFPFMVPSVI